MHRPAQCRIFPVRISASHLNYDQFATLAHQAQAFAEYGLRRLESCALDASIHVNSECRGIKGGVGHPSRRRATTGDKRLFSNLLRLGWACNVTLVFPRLDAGRHFPSLSPQRSAAVRYTLRARSNFHHCPCLDRPVSQVNIRIAAGLVAGWGVSVFKP